MQITIVHRVAATWDAILAKNFCDYEIQNKKWRCMIFMKLNKVYLTTNCALHFFFFACIHHHGDIITFII